MNGAYLCTKLSKKDGRHVLRAFEKPEAVRPRKCGGYFLLFNRLDMDIAV